MRRLCSRPEDKHHHALLGGGLSVMQHFQSAISEVNKLIRHTNPIVIPKHCPALPGSFRGPLGIMFLQNGSTPPSVQSAEAM